MKKKVFDFLKKSVLRIFGAKTEPEKSGSKCSKSSDAKGKNGRKKPQNEVKKSAKGEKLPTAKRTAAQDKARKAEKSAEPQKRKTPPRPESLKDVPAVEGKMRFLDLALHESVQYSVQYAGFEYCTPIQKLALPALLEGRDLAARAQTGTGKTAAFLLASFTKLLNNPLAERKKAAPRILVLAPTRELAAQIHSDAEKLGVYTGLNSVVVFGGMDYDKQRRSLDTELDLVIGTPGRVIDYSRSGFLDLSKVEILVIDEADRMLDMGFIPDVKRIVSMIPRKGERQTLMFSATLDDSILRLSSGWLADPYVVESEPDQLVSGNIEQKFYSVSRDEKLAVTLHILNNTQFERLIIFGNRKDVNLRLQYDLARYGHLVPVLSGDIPQEKRIKILEKFRSGEEKVIIATDVAARGIHVDNVSLVINYDLPERSEDYIHRIGRTGRAGNTGCAISFLCEYGAYYLPAIEELLKTTFPSELPPEEMLVLPPEDPKAKLPSKNGSTSGSGRGNKKPGNFRRRR